jgi:BCCT family betaine/carnitine transporter
MRNGMKNQNKPIDRIVFSMAVFTALLLSIPLILFSDSLGPTIIKLYNWTALHLGFILQWAVIGSIIAVLVLVLSRYGRIKLGDPDDTPDFSLFSWVAMLFSAGVGGGLLYWAGIEWAYYYVAPPFGAEARSTEAAMLAAQYGLFHWGIGAWTIYALPSIAISYAFYVRKIPYLRFSAAVLGERCISSPWAKLVDLTFMFGLIGGAGTSLALAAPVVSAGLAELTGIQRNTGMDIGVIVICVTLFGGSVYLGLEKGIKALANLNLYLSFFLLAFIFIAGPTAFFIMMGTESIGGMFNDFVKMLTWTDPIENSGFVQDWTIFYWAWWISFAPYVGLFVTRISKGRTIAQVGLGMCFFGSLGAWAFYIILGNYALHLELTSVMPVAEMVAKDAPAAIAKVIHNLPAGGVILAVFLIVVSVFVATTYDSASYSLAASATQELKPDENPARWHRLFWAGVLGLMPVGLIFIGGLKVVQSAVLLSSLPIAIVGIFMTRTLFRWLREDTPSKVNYD